MSDTHDHAPIRAAQRRVLWVALVANGCLMLAEIAGGLVFNSLALLADAAHMASDVGGLGVALVAQRLVERPASPRHSFGLQRAEVLGALANGLLLLATAGYILIEAVRRLPAPPPVEGAGLLAVAALGLLVNLASAALIAGAAGRSLNLRGAYTHMLADAAGSVGAVAAGIAVVTAGADWVDPLVSVLIALGVVWSAWRLLRDTVHVLLEGTPSALDPVEVERTLRTQPVVESVHHVHLWNLASDTPAMSAHVVLIGEIGLHEAQQRGEELKTLLAERHGIGHATLELECHSCGPAEVHR